MCAAASAVEHKRWKHRSIPCYTSRCHSKRLALFLLLGREATERMVSDTPLAILEDRPIGGPSEDRPAS